MGVAETGPADRIHAAHVFTRVLARHDTAGGRTPAGVEDGGLAADVAVVNDLGVAFVDPGDDRITDE